MVKFFNGQKKREVECSSYLSCFTHQNNTPQKLNSHQYPSLRVGLLARQLLAIELPFIPIRIAYQKFIQAVFYFYSDYFPCCLDNFPQTVAPFSCFVSSIALWTAKSQAGAQL
jgi:hypothetical protein